MPEEARERLPSCLRQEQSGQPVGPLQGLFDLIVGQAAQEVLHARIDQAGPAGKDIPGTREDRVGIDADAADIELGETIAGRDITAVGRAPGPVEAFLEVALAAASVDQPGAEIELGGIVVLERRLRQPYEGQSILDTGLAAGLSLPYACKGGVCCTCRAKVLEGEVAMDKNYTLEDYEVEQGFVLTCQARPLTERVVVSYDER